MQKFQNTYHLIGLMSGSSLDGLDLAYCQFNFVEGQWNFTLLQSKTADLNSWAFELKNALSLNDNDLKDLSKKFASYLATEVNLFIEEFSITRIGALVSHGHTIYHYPEKGITCQIGDGQILAAETGLTVINNLRQKDVDLGGQGAPIVPIGDLHLFKEYGFCLNIGGIANISLKTNIGIQAYDICTANQVLNHYANKLNLSYDNEGHIAREGVLNVALLNKLNQFDFYQLAAPKSLDNGFSKRLMQQIDVLETSVENILRTYVEHIAEQVSFAIKKAVDKQPNLSKEKQQILITGGGAFNTFLVERIQDKLDMNVVVPDKELVDYKEAIVMAFIGVLKLRDEVNVLASVTGASRNSSCGDCYYPIGN